MEASQVVWLKGLFRCQIPTCSVVGTMQLSQHGAALQESSWAQQDRASVSCELCYSIVAIGGNEAIPTSHKEPAGECIGLLLAAIAWWR